ncbi:MAG: amidohydrolase family protein, partial [Pseudomonadales bacterium]|nr:amidohydrolase family protein [Pseudomonadales bacterium]
MYDIVIRGGSLIDGSGSEPTPGDLAIEDGLIVAVGDVDGKGKEEIDATGQMVTPGFIDIHTHLDAQIGWDPDMTPISWHGVTTALIGNCGVTFAPCKAEDRELLAGMMETGEDIPKDAILSGLAWDWEHYPEYLDSITRLGTAVNVAGLVGHSAVRYYVMGERAVEEQATDDEKKQMAAIAANAVQGGAFGFSTNRYEPHKGPDGRSIPGTFADVGELVEIAGAIAPHNGLMQAVGANFEVLSAIADIPGARVLFSYGTAPEDGAGKRAAEALDALCKGRDVTAISHVRGSGYMFGLQSGLPFKGETWSKLAAMDFSGRRSAIENDEMVQALIDEARAEGSHVPMERVYYLGSGEVPDYTRKENLMEMASNAGEHWSETFIRLTRESDGMGLFNFRMFATNLKEQADLFKSRNIYPG